MRKVKAPKKSKRCTAEELAARLKKPATLDAWSLAAHKAVSALGDNGRVEVEGFGRFALRAHPKGRELTFSFHPELKNLATGYAPSLAGMGEVGAAFLAVLRDGYEEIVVPRLGTIRVTFMDAFDGINPATGEDVPVGAKNVLELVIDPALLKAVGSTPRRQR